MKIIRDNGNDEVKYTGNQRTTVTNTFNYVTGQRKTEIDSVDTGFINSMKASRGFRNA